MWVNTMWPIIDGHFLGRGVDISRLPAKRFISVLENYWIEDQIRHIQEPEQQSNEKERIRAEFIKYNRRSKSYMADEENDNAGDNAPPGPVQYLEEVTEGGFLPGLEDGFVG